tara:strand:+ start:506 stop:826 length:321 start_codon:yes stop_codon:yes gene_type:complete
MIHIQIDPILLSEKSRKTVQKLKKKVEKELLLFPELQLSIEVKTRTAKANIITMYATYANQRFFEDEFVSKNWESTIQQCASYLTRSIRSEFLKRKSRKIVSYDTF